MCISITPLWYIMVPEYGYWFMKLFVDACDKCVKRLYVI